MHDLYIVFFITSNLIFNLIVNLRSVALDRCIINGLFEALLQSLSINKIHSTILFITLIIFLRATTFTYFFLTKMQMPDQFSL